MSAIHKALKLPSPYRARTSIDGYVGELENARHFSLRWMTSPTGGTVSVWAVRESFGAWQEISGQRFHDLASQIINSRAALRDAGVQ